MEVIVKGQPSIEIGFETKVIQVGGLGDIDSVLSTESENPVMNKVITAELGNKVDKELGKGLSTNDFTTSEKEKLAGLENYDDAELRGEVESLATEVESNNELIEDLQNTKIDKEADDYYPQLAVGLADNLAGVDVVDSEINFRRSGGGAISDGVARIESIKGNSVVWNQTFKAYAGSIGTKVVNGVTFTLTAEGDVTAEGTAEGASAVCTIAIQDIINGHKYLIIAPSVTSEWGVWALYINGHTVSGNSSLVVNGFKIFTATASTQQSSMVLTCWADNTISVKTKVAIYDLTQMFQAGNEPTTIEEFYSRIPMGVDLNSYNEGEVIHMDVQSIESQGVNQWGGQLEEGKLSSNGEPTTGVGMARSKEFMRVLPSTSYFEKHDKINGTSVFFYPSFYDSEYNFISSQSSLNNQVFNTPSNAVYMRFYLYCSAQAIPLDYDICINISDTSINGKYFPYIKRVEDLSIIRKYFPNGMKSAGSAHDEIRYNKATQKWEYSKGKIKNVDLGTCDWKQDESDATRFRTLAITWKATYTNNLLCEKYATAPTQDILLPDKSIAMTNSQISPLFRVKDSAYTDAASLKASLQGVILYYESNDWEWEELDAEDQFKDLDYQVWNCGTEKAIAEGKSAPLAADITYGFNAIGKIKELESLVAALREKVGI